MTGLTFAYLDPGSSSMIVQMLLGGVAAAGVALKLYWRRLLKFLHLRKADPEEGLTRPARARRTAEPDAADAPAVNGAERAPVESSKR